MSTRACEGCDYRVVAAIEEIAARWKPYTASSRRYSIFKLLEETIDPAWNDYVKSFPVKDARRHYGIRFVFSKRARKGGTLRVDDELRDLVRRVAQASDPATRNEAMSPRERWIYPPNMDRPSHSERVFLQTVSALRFLASDLYCEGKLPHMILSDRQKKASSNKKKEKEPSPGDLCKTCGELTEFAVMPRDEDLPWSVLDGTAKLSRRFCAKHRPKIGGEWNSAYRRARRSDELFNHQIFLLKRHTVNLDSFTIPQSQGIGDKFLWELGHRQDLIPLENQRLRRLARELADCKITQRKAWIVMLSEKYPQTAIAHALGVTRQAVSKFMATESFKRLTEIYRRFA
jgi:hypothetical protein